MVETLLSKATGKPLPPPRALVVPHAGYIYSGAVAASAYATLTERRAEISRVILLGPNHRVPLQHIAATSAQSFTTPLGDIAIDRDCIDELQARGLVIIDDAPHREEHSLETQLPFLQKTLDSWQLVPLVVGSVPYQQVAELLDGFIDDHQNLIVVSSDLSHFHHYREAQSLDAQTQQLIQQRRPELSPQQACGSYPLNGLLHLANRRHFDVVTLMMCNSGDTSGDRERVVGYGSYCLV